MLIHSISRSCRRLWSLPLIFCLALISLSSCSKGSSADVEDLLATIPADASAVVTVNVQGVLEKLDCKISGSDVTPGKELQALLDSEKGSSGLAALFKGDYAIEPTAAAIFIEGRDVYLTGYLSDPEKFKAAVKKDNEADWTSSDGVETCLNMAVKSNQFWVRTSHYNAIDPSEIRRFTELSSKLSYASNSHASDLAKLEHDLNGIGNLAGILNASSLSFASKQMTRMAIEALFADAVEVEFNADFDKGKLSAYSQLITSKGTPAKFLFPIDRIDPEVVKTAGQSADIIIAAALSEKMIAQLTKEVGSKGISMLNVILQTFSAVDGTCVALSGDNEVISGFFTVKNEGTASLTDMLTGAGYKVDKDGNRLSFNNGSVTGSLNIAKEAPKFKGAIIGMVCSVANAALPVKSASKTSKLTSVSLMLTPADGTVSLQASLESSDPARNILLDLLEE